MNSTISNIATRISLLLFGVIAIIWIVLSYLTGITINIILLSLVNLAVSISSFFIIRFIVGKFVFEKIKPIYRTVYNVKKEGVGIKPNPIYKDDMVTEVENQVMQWADTKSKEIERLKQMETYRKEFLGNVSHELKTPIFNIQGYILTLLDGGLEDESINRNYLIRTEKSIERLINIVSDLEAISKLEHGELLLEFTSFNIVQLTNEIIDSLEISISQRNTNVIFDNANDKAIMVHADRSRINHVITNLIVNGINYGKENGEVKISFHDVDDNVLIEIADNGIGIAQQDLSRIFERFYRADKSRSREQGGTGLGLSIVKHILDAHGQTINVASIVGQGTTFSFTLNKG